MNETTNIKVYLLVLAFATASGITSLVTGRYTTLQACRNAASMTLDAPRAENTQMSAICVPSEE